MLVMKTFQLHLEISLIFNSTYLAFGKYCWKCFGNKNKALVTHYFALI